MALKIVNGKDLNKDFLNSIYQNEYEIFGADLCGSKERLNERFEACNDSFLVLFDGDKMVGHLNFFPVKKDLYNSFIDENDHRFMDDDIRSGDLKDWTVGESHDIFIISIAIKSDYRKGDAVRMLGNGFLEFLRQKNAEGYTINSITGFAVSDGGKRFLKRFKSGYIKTVEHGYLCLSASPENVRHILRKGLNLYKKTFNDDIYFFIPLSYDKHTLVDKNNFSGEKPLKLCDLVCKDPDDFANEYRDRLNEHIEYECTNDTFKKEHLNRYFMGKFSIGIYDDDYIDESGLAPDYIEDSYLFITEHKDTGLYIATVAVPDNKYSPSQLIDQMSTDNLKLEFEKANFTNLLDYLKKFGLIPCGDAKCVTCMSNMPENEKELPYILSGETMVSQHITYEITEQRRKSMLENHACYDYYDSYISDSVVAFVFSEYAWRDNCLERLSAEASVQFVIEIVLFQNAAVHRTNMNVVNAFSSEKNLTNSDIIDLYGEFGKTMTFWSSNVFKYPFSQKEADEVIKCFGISKTLDEYHRNQQFLDRYIELKNNDANVRSDHLMNHTLFFLSCMEGCSLTLAAVLWIASTISGGKLDGIIHADFAVRAFWILICVAVCIIIFKRINKLLDQKNLKSKKTTKKRRKI